MNRRRFLSQGCSCGLLLAASSFAEEKPSEALVRAAKVPTVPMNPQQIAAVLSQVDRSGDEAVIGAVFDRWGVACFEQSKSLRERCERLRADFPGYVARINEGADRFWERLDYDETGGVLRVLGRKATLCPCAYSRSPNPPKALCTHCCRNFQQRLFEALTGRRAEVEIDESVILGGERCSTTIRLHEKLPA